MNPVQTLGDTHLGKVFKTGVPLHRLGEREAMVWCQFTKEVMEPREKIHIHLGDLFDKAIVPPTVVLRAAEVYRAAAQVNADTEYYILMGNHDPFKDADKKSSFDIFEQLMEGVKNVTVVREPMLVHDVLGLCPFNVFGTAEETFEKLLEQGTPEVVFGHWDVLDYGGDNVIPTKLMQEHGITHAITGHDHLAREEERHGVHIDVNGSMQPYTHSEDNTGTWYVTVTLDELFEEDRTNQNVRVLLQEGEVLPEELDCLSIIGKRISTEGDDLEVDTTEFDQFDLGTALSEALPDAVREDVMTYFEEARKC